MKNIFPTALRNAAATALYVGLIGSFFFYIPRFFGPTPAKDTVLAPIVMLSLLVFSAALTGSLVFGQPILWYLDGRKREALSLFTYTLVIFLIITLAAVFALFFSAI